MSENQGIPSACASACRRSGSILVSLVWMTAGLANALADGSPPDAPELKANRTVPQAQPLKSSLQFSANPTTEEIFRAHVFQEPLVVVGSEPTTAENSDLVAALL